MEGTRRTCGRVAAASFSAPLNVPHHKTNDPYLASFVLSEGGEFAGCTRLGPKKVEFRFVANRHLHALLRLYWRAVPTIVIPVRLFAALRRLKSRPPVRK